MNLSEEEYYRKSRLRAIHIIVALVFSAVLFFTGCDELNSDPEIDPRSRLVDSWMVDESSSYYKSGLEVYRIEIYKHPTDSSKIGIYNFFNVDANAEAILSDRRLTLPHQSLDGGFSVSGTGEIQSGWNEIIWSYDVDDGSGVRNDVAATYTRIQ